MKYRDGYLVSNEDVMQLSLEDIEDLAYRTYKDSYLTEEAKTDILEVYLDCRWRKKQQEFVYNEENLKRMEMMNDLLIRQTEDVVRTAYEIFLQETQANNLSDKKYEIEVVPQLLVPSTMYWEYKEPYQGTYTERDERMWEVLCSSSNKKLKWYRILTGSDITHSYQDKELENYIEEYFVWGESLKDSTPEQRSWGGVMSVNHEKTKGICFCWAFHNLLDFMNFSMDDILKVKQFKMEVEVNYEPINERPC